MINVEMTSKNGTVLATNGKYCADNIKVTPTNAENIKAENIKSGVEILGITGTITDATKMVNEIIERKIEEIKIPDNITIIGSYAFSYCLNLTRAILPNGLKTIGMYAFMGCDLTSLNIPDTTTNIGIYAFRQCTALINITIPNSLTAIGNKAFDGCKNLEFVTIKNEFNCNNLDLSVSTKYSADTIVGWLNALADRSAETTQYTLKIGEANLAKLADEQKEIATNKGWILA